MNDAEIDQAMACLKANGWRLASDELAEWAGVLKRYELVLLRRAVRDLKTADEWRSRRVPLVVLERTMRNYQRGIWGKSDRPPVETCELCDQGMLTVPAYHEGDRECVGWMPNMEIHLRVYPCPCSAGKQRGSHYLSPEARDWHTDEANRDAAELHAEGLRETARRIDGIFMLPSLPKGTPRHSLVTRLYAEHVVATSKQERYKDIAADSEAIEDEASEGR